MEELLDMIYDEFENERTKMKKRNMEINSFGLFESCPKHNAQKLFRKAIKEMKINDLNEIEINNHLFIGIQKRRKID